MTENAKPSRNTEKGDEPVAPIPSSAGAGKSPQPDFLVSENISPEMLPKERRTAVWRTIREVLDLDKPREETLKMLMKWDENNNPHVSAAAMDGMLNFALTHWSDQFI